MPSVHFALVGFALVFLHNNDNAFAAAQSSSSTNDVGSYILEGLGSTESTASATVLPSAYYGNSTSSNITASTISSSSIIATTSLSESSATTTSQQSSTTSLISSSSLTTISTTDQGSQTSFTTFTSLCVENGTSIIHTHSAPITYDSVTSTSASSSSLAANSSSESSISSAVSTTLNATSPSSPTSGTYASANSTTSTLVGGPTASYASSSSLGYINGTNITIGPASITTTAGQHTAVSGTPWTVGSNGTGFSYGSMCYGEWESYWEASRTLMSPYTTGYQSTFFVTNYSVPLTTLCNGNTQVNGPLQVTGVMTLSQTAVASIYPATLTVPPEPSCTVPRDQCDAVGVQPGLISGDIPRGCSISSSASCGQCTISGSDIHVLYFAVSTAANVTRDVCAPSPTAANNACPYGSWVTSTVPSTQTFTGVTVTGSSIELYDFGTSTNTVTNQLSTAQVYTSTYTETLSECVYSSAGLGGYNNASSIVSNGATFYANNIYLSFKSVWAVDDCGSTVGTPRAGSLIGLPTSEVYSVCTQSPAGSIAVPYNVQDLSGYVPMSAWDCQPYCMSVANGLAQFGMGKGPGPTPDAIEEFVPNARPDNFYVNDHQVFVTGGGFCGAYPSQEWYKPHIAVPPQVRALDPEWANCILDFQGWYDPPSVITQVTSAEGPSTPNAVTTSAQPASTQVSALPSSTPAPTTAKSTAAPAPAPYSSSATSTSSPAASGVSPTPYSSSEPSEVSSEESMTAASSTSSAVAPSAYSDTIASSVQTSSQGNAPSSYDSSSADATSQAISNIISVIAPQSSTTTIPSDPSSSAASPIAFSSTTEISAQVSSSAASNVEPTSSDVNVPSTYSSDSPATTSQAISNIISALDPGTSTSSSAPVSTDPAQSSIDPSETSSLSANDQPSVADSATSVVDQTATSNAVSSAPAALSSTAQASTVAADPSTSAQSDSVSTLFQYDPTTQATTLPLQTTISVAGTSLTISQVSSGGAVVVGSSTISQGSQATINGQTISVGQSGVQVGTTTISADPAPASSEPVISSDDPGATAVVTTNGQTLTAIQYSASTILAAESSTVILASDQPATIGGQTVSIASSGSGLVINDGSTAVFSSSPQSTDPPQVITVASSAYTVVGTSDAQGSSALIIAAGTSTAILAVGQTTQIGSVAVSAPSSGGAVIGSGSNAATVRPAPSSSEDNLPAPAFTVVSIGASALTVIQTGSSVVFVGVSSTLTLAQGASGTLAGQTVVADSSAGNVIVGSSTFTIDQPAPAPTQPTQAVVTASDGQQVTVSQQGSSIILAAGTSKATLAQGSTTIFAGQTISADSSVGGVLVGSSSVLLTQPSYAAPQAIVTASDGQQVTFSQQGSSVVLAAGTSKVTLAQGSTTVFAGQTVSAASSPGAVLVGSSSILLSSSSYAAPQAIVTASNGQQVTAVQQGSSVVLAVGSSSTTLAQGSSATFAGQTIAAYSSGIVVDGSSVQLSTPPAATPGAVFTGSAGQSITVQQQGQSYVVQDGTSTINLAPGSGTTFAGATVSVPSSSDSAPSHAVVNGETVTLSSVQVPSADSLSTGAILTGVNDQPVTIVQQGSSYVVQQGSSTLSLQPGSATSFGGISVSAPSTGGAPVVNEQPVTLSALPSSPSEVAIEAVVTGSASQLVTVRQSGSSYIVQDASSTTTLGAGSTASFDGHSISVPTSGMIAVVDDNTISLSTTTRARTSGTLSESQSALSVSRGNSGTSVVSPASASLTSHGIEQFASSISTLSVVVASVFLAICCSW
ncbi:hypothetical protein LTR17_012803 [Elasticomyces elasticus]|nr:hypothetical protein LTR17_012803 [Elasticomyces elasticus]